MDYKKLTDVSISWGGFWLGSLFLIAGCWYRRLDVFIVGLQIMMLSWLWAIQGQISRLEVLK